VGAIYAGPHSPPLLFLPHCEKSVCDARHSFRRFCSHHTHSSLSTKLTQVLASHLPETNIGLPLSQIVGSSQAELVNSRQQSNQPRSTISSPSKRVWVHRSLVSRASKPHSAPWRNCVCTWSTRFSGSYPSPLTAKRLSSIFIFTSWTFWASCRRTFGWSWRATASKFQQFRCTSTTTWARCPTIHLQFWFLFCNFCTKLSVEVGHQAPTPHT